ncbi:transmembrane amino acid transporter protein domain-containing protein [Ditylenchus destructor]|uniref:Transmembrane amino acid transporter protein domain-containing protein n=1 Tax=Ditylenchus destructor TaxID=166010 RepID=A0AAD4R8Z1_9BILA|nr:transmembrane amino acid transporter protein domain-containing protein [Ditylenchus destructor]
MANDGANTAEVQSFSTTVGLLYIFNLIVGTGALALPKAFQTAGYVLSIVLLICSAFTSYICATFVIECLAIANAALKLNPTLERRRLSTSTELSSSDESLDILPNRRSSTFEIIRRLELSELANIFLGRTGVAFTYLILTIYLFGDLAIYSTTVPKSLMNVICSTVNVTSDYKYALCHPGDLSWHLSRFTVYRICVTTFALFCLPMVLVGMTKTKYLQLSTTLSRWTAFILMISLASIQLFQKGAQASPPSFELHGFGSFFGVAIYAFMCHHSIPGLITPMREKEFISFRLIYVYLIIFLFYCALSITGSFAFPVVQDVYTLNFLHDDQTGFFYLILDYFLALFPVFTLTSSYIIVAITLSNNIRVLIGMIRPKVTNTVTSHVNTENEALLSNSTSEDEIIAHDLSNRILPALRSPTGSMEEPPSPVNNVAPERIFSPTLAQRLSGFGKELPLPTLVILLPTMLSFYTDNVLLLASITGSYPGVGVQFLIPAILTVGARAYQAKQLRLSIPEENASPFRHWLWPYAIIGWAAFALVMVSVNIFHLG